MHVTHSANQIHQVQVGLKLQNTLHKLQKEAHINIDSNINIMVIAQKQTLKELVAPNMEN